MKLAEHVDTIRNLIHKSFVNYFARLGITANRQMDMDKIPAEQRAKREKLNRIIENHIGETGSFVAAYEKALDEYTFTLFNRIAAIKVMEAHMLFPEIITKRPEQGNRSFSHKAWLEQNRGMANEELEGIREFIKYEFNKLGEKIPLFHKDYHYALLPYVIELNDIIEAFNDVEKDRNIDRTIWQSDDILGWLYESYNSAKKQAHKAGKQKTEYDKVSLQSQVYTPRWVVKFLVDNSLGKLYLEMFPDSEIKAKYQIANAPDTRVRDEKPLPEIKIIDPATGSGNFLYYAFDLFHDLYMDQIDNYGADYDEDDIAKLIIENNLHGIDLDDRAVQIAQLGLYIKAMRRNQNVKIEKFNVVSSDFFLPEYIEVKDIFDEERLDLETKNLIKEIWSDLRMAYKFGSLVKIEEKVNQKIDNVKERAKKTSFGLEGLLEKWEKWKETVIPQLHQAVDQHAVETGNDFIGIKTRDALIYLTVLTTKYDVAVANPPYTDSADFGPELKRFVKGNYKKPHKFHTNLYACFIKRCTELIHKNGFAAMVHPPTFMYIKTFEGVRKYILQKYLIDTFVDWGYLGMFHPSARVDSCMYILGKKNENIDSQFIRLSDLYEGKRKKAFGDIYQNLVDKKDDPRLFKLPQSKLEIIKSWPFIYWISDQLRAIFQKETLASFSHVAEGLTTANNNKFLRYWWEVDPNNLSRNFQIDKKRWIPYAKGGEFNKYYGNMWTVLDWKNGGSNIKSEKGGSIRNESYYFRQGITFSASGTKGINYRLLDTTGSFDSVSRSIFFPNDIDIYYAVILLNSKTLRYLAKCLNPTVNTTVGDVKRLPFIYSNVHRKKEIISYAKTIVSIKKYFLGFNLKEKHFSKPILIWALLLNKKATNNTKLVKSYLDHQNFILSQIIVIEHITNEFIFDVYNLTPTDKAMVIAKEGESIGNLPVQPEAKNAYLTEEIATKEFPLNNIKKFIQDLPEKEFTPEERKKITEGFPTLYQKNNDLEEFCIRHQVNPINVWYWFKESNVVPKQRMNTIAMEFLADLIREILMEDEDGIAPLVRSSGEEILIDRIEKKFMDKGFSPAQFAQFDKVLGRELNDYLNNHFFKALSDHLNLFMYLPKTPFIWHITSGPNHGFDAYIIIYKWNRDRLLLLKSVYIEKRETALKNRQSDLQNDDSAKAQNEKDLIFKQLKEITNLKTKIDELLAESYDPILDDGVGKNIAPLQNKGIIAYDVLNKGQLEKYLHADW
jgi:hypothetical protein